MSQMKFKIPSDLTVLTYFSLQTTLNHGLRANLGSARQNLYKSIYDRKRSTVSSGQTEVSKSAPEKLGPVGFSGLQF